MNTDEVTHTYTHRYQSAWSEINSRIEARQQVAIYLAVTNATIAAATAAGAINSPTLLRAIAIALAFITWTFICWIHHHNSIIGLLSRYCSTLERVERTDTNAQPNGPDWHTPEAGWIITALGYRRWFDYGVAAIILPGILPAVFAATSAPDAISLAIDIAAAIAMSAAALFVLIAFRRKRQALLG